MKDIKLPADLTFSARELQRVGAATEKDLDPIFVLTMGIKRRSELDDQRCLVFLQQGAANASMTIALMKVLGR